jgi:hypothetical protein
VGPDAAGPEGPDDAHAGRPPPDGPPSRGGKTIVVASCEAAGWGDAVLGPGVAGDSCTGSSSLLDGDVERDVIVAGSASPAFQRAATGPCTSWSDAADAVCEEAPARCCAPAVVTDGRSGRAPTVGSVGDAARETVGSARADVGVTRVAARGIAVVGAAATAAVDASCRWRATESMGRERAGVVAATTGSCA